MRIFVGNLIRRIGKKICGHYWVCRDCGVIKFKEEEVGCWHCPTGEMVYQGVIPKTRSQKN